MIAKRTEVDTHGQERAHAADQPSTQAPSAPSQPAESEAEPALSEVSTQDIRHELQRRQRHLASLHRKRARLRKELADVEVDIATYEPRPAMAPLPPARRRPLDSLPLREALPRVMAIGDIVSPKDATDRLIGQGYGSRARNLRVQVTQALSGESRFKRVARGKYERIV